MSTSNDVNGILIERANGYGETNGVPPVASKPKPPVASKPASNKPVVNAKPAPPVKRKPLLKSQSVDTHARNGNSKACDLTQVGGSEWKDFVLRRQSSDETEQPQAIRSLNMHRQSLTCADTTITEGHVFETPSLNDNNSPVNDSVDAKTSVESDSLQETEVKSELISAVNNGVANGGTPRVMNSEHVLKTEINGTETTNQNGRLDVGNTTVAEQAPVTNGVTEKSEPLINGVEKHESSANPVVIGFEKTGTVVNGSENLEPALNGSEKKLVTEKKELNGFATETPACKPFDHPTFTTTTEASTGFVLPKPRQIVSEIKRTSFAKSRSMSLPSTHLAPQLKRSSDMLKEASAKPYFCRLSRGSVDILNSDSLAGLSIKEEAATDNASSETAITN